METSCLFCQIAEGKVKSNGVYEDEHVLVFEDIHPKAPVHLLVIPKIHIKSIAHLDKDQGEIVSKLIYTAKDIADKQGLSGYKLIFNVGREGGQIIDHLHLHLLGGWLKNENNKIEV